jgi:putative membrane protein
MPIMFAIGVYSGVIGYLEVEYWKLADTSYVKNITIMHGMLGFVISLLLVLELIPLMIDGGKDEKCGVH